MNIARIHPHDKFQALPCMCYPKKACKPWISTISLSQNCATTRNIKRLWPHLISYEGGQDKSTCQIPNFRSFLPCVLQKMFRNLRFYNVNCAKIRKINITWCKSNWFRRWSGYIIIPNFRPLLYVPQKCLWCLKTEAEKTGRQNSRMVQKNKLAQT